VSLDLASRQPPWPPGDHQVIHPAQAALPLGHDPRGERGVPVPRHLDLDRPGLGEHGLDDVADAQLPSGAFTDVAPRLTRTGSGAPAWGDAGVIVPWTV
jgi:hypothetical protein